MFTAAQLWPVPSADTTEVAGVALPPGQQVIAREADKPAPVAWISNDILDADTLTDHVRALAAVYPTTGLWPLRAELYRDSLQRPWFDGELGGLDTRTVDAAGILAGRPAPEYTSPADPVPGQSLSSAMLNVTQPGGLLLVPTHRPADVPKVLGWPGGCNYDILGESASAVLRSWEDRFGTTITGIGFDTMSVQFARTPETSDQLRRLAFEVFAFCPDLDEAEPDDLAEFISDEHALGFWWD